MDSFRKIIQRLTLIITAVGIVFLLGVMGIVVANVIVRLAGGAIQATFEFVELMSVLAVGASIIYTAHSQGNIKIVILFSRFSPRTQAILETITTFLTIMIMVAIGWATTELILDTVPIGLEPTFLLHIPVIPFKGLWVLYVAIVCMVLLLDLINSLNNALKVEDNR